MIDKPRLIHIAGKFRSFLRRENWRVQGQRLRAATAAPSRSDVRRAETDPEEAGAYDPQPRVRLANPARIFNLINSVAFHPTEMLCCATFSQSHKVGVFRVDEAGQITLLQLLSAPRAQLRTPQHAVFSGDGRHLIVSNWHGGYFTLYRRGLDGCYSQKPVAHLPYPAPLKAHKPHGMDVSPSGKYLAVAYGAAEREGKAIALMALQAEGQGLSLLSHLSEAELPGIPKGITFSPDERCLLVTFSNINSIQVFGLSDAPVRIQPQALQTVQGPITTLCRPEDIKVSPTGDRLVVSNSGSDQLAFFAYDPLHNRITEDKPCQCIDAQVSGLKFPHGLAFSPDGAWLLVSHFGPLKTTQDEEIGFDSWTPRQQSGIAVFARRPQAPSVMA